MPATRSRTSTEQPEVAEEVKKNDSVVEQSEENTKESIDKTTDESNDNTTSTTTEEKEAESEENADSEAKDTNGEEKVEENGSAKRKSIDNPEGDGPDSTEITPKKVKVDDETSGDQQVVKEDETTPQVEAV